MSQPDLRQIIGQLYRMTAADVQGEFERIFRQRREAYREAMAEQAQRVGCSQAAQRARYPSGASLAQLRDESKQEAQGIADTWNRDVEAEIARLFAANKRGNRFYYYSNMERWAEERGAWKDRQISASVIGLAKSLAGQDFERFNNLSATYQFTGPAPGACEVCRDFMASGPVPASVKRANEAPIHAGCWHGWVIAGLAGGVNCADLWVG